MKIRYPDGSIEEIDSYKERKLNEFRVKFEVIKHE